MGLFRRMVWTLWITSIFLGFVLLLNLINIRSLDGILTTMGAIWLFTTVLFEIYFVNM